MRESTKAKVALCAFVFMYGVIGLIMVLAWVALMYQGVLSSNNKNKKR